MSVIGQVLIPIVTLAIGSIVGWYIQRIWFRTILFIELQRSFTVSPKELGVQDHLKIEYDDFPVNELHLYYLRVTNRGKRDIHFPIDKDNRKAMGIKFPHIYFKNFRILGFHTLNNDETKFYIALAKALANKAVVINIRNLRASFTAEFLIVGTPEEGYSGQVWCREGFLPDIRIQTGGILNRGNKKTADR